MNNDEETIEHLLVRVAEIEAVIACIAKREPTQAEGDKHEHYHQPDNAPSHASGACDVELGNHRGRRCGCGVWVWGGPTQCEACAECGVLRDELSRLARQLRNTVGDIEALCKDRREL